MRRIFLKMCICIGFLPVAVLVGLMIGALVAQASYAIGPNFIEPFFPRQSNHVWSLGHPMLAAIFFGAIAFGMVSFFLSILILPVSLVFKEPREMVRQIGIAGLVMTVFTLLFGISISTYAMLSKQGFENLHHIVEVVFPIDDSRESLSALLLFQGAIVGMVFGTSLSLMNMIRAWRTGQSLKEHLLYGDSPLSQIASLIYPPNGLKYIFVFVTALSLFCDWEMTHKNLLVGTYVFGFGGAMWAAAAGYLYEFVLTKMGRNSHFMEQFYSEISTDLYVLIVFSISVFLFYWILPRSYSMSNLDLGFLGAPYFLYVVATLRECGRTKVVNRTLPKGLTRLFITSIVIAYFGMFSIFYLIQTDSMSEMQSLWWQITVFSTSVFALIASRLLLFILKSKRLEVSPIWLEMLGTTRFSSGLYAALSKFAPEWNERIRKEKMRLRKERSRKRKK